MKRYELILTDGRKSFYGKAIVEVEENGTEPFTAIIPLL